MPEQLAPENYEMVEGKNKVLLFRRFKDRGDKNAIKLVFQTEHTTSYERDMDSVITKDGPILRVGELQTNVEITAIQAKRDPTFKMLRDTVINGERLEVWEVDIDPEGEDDDGKFPAMYAQGYLESWEDTSSAEDEPEVTGTLNVDMHPQFDTATFDFENQEDVQYAFRDTVNDSGSGGDGGDSDSGE